MSIVTGYLSKSGITDMKEVSMLENFFQNPEIIGEMEQAEKNRIRRYAWLVPSIVIISALIFYFFSLGTGTVKIEYGGTSTTRPSDWFDGIIWVVMLSILVAGGIIKMFHSKIEGAIKSKILTRLSKELYSKLEYNEGKKYFFGDVGKLVSLGFLRGYDTIETIEDSLGFTIQENGKYVIVQGYELKTSKTHRDSKGRRHKSTTNRCYLLKASFPSARIPLNSNLFIKKDMSDSFQWRKYIIPMIGAFIGGVIFASISNDSIFMVLGGLFTGVGSYFLQHKFLQRKRIVLENPEFEKLFDVKCEDPIGSRMIVTPSFMDRLVQFSKNSKYQYEFLYEKNCFYVKWNVNDGYLEINTWKKITTNIGGFIDWYLQMKEIISLIFDMKMLYFSNTVPGYIESNITPEYEYSSERIGESNESYGKDIGLAIGGRILSSLIFKR